MNSMLILVGKHEMFKMNAVVECLFKTEFNKLFNSLKKVGRKSICSHKSQVKCKTHIYAWE